ncbi:nucleolar and coiled-body phosphoprotein 1 isoform X2 [Hyalella azteca]|uniref:Nucleolar and coiled-body phosphoprotein 1 isoform X2 n=1 Tax=Hyalella azteca TaxID=294128 RepID=A0A979FF05_HYAAZ|nr:nucleolar and coiled-body phosphoprotein 1 isoform X2 [Hyalella azteca]
MNAFKKIVRRTQPFRVNQDQKSSVQGTFISSPDASIADFLPPPKASLEQGAGAIVDKTDGVSTSDSEDTGPPPSLVNDTSIDQPKKPLQKRIIRSKSQRAAITNVFNETKNEEEQPISTDNVPSSAPPAPPASSKPKAPAVPSPAASSTHASPANPQKVDLDTKIYEGSEVNATSLSNQVSSEDTSENNITSPCKLNLEKRGSFPGDVTEPPPATKGHRPHSYSINSALLRADKPRPRSTEKLPVPLTGQRRALSSDTLLDKRVHKSFPEMEKSQIPSAEKPYRVLANKPPKPEVHKPLPELDLTRPSSIENYNSLSDRSLSVISELPNAAPTDCPAMNGSNEKLLHLNQQRPKGPSRRPPSAVFKENMRNSSESDSNSGLSSLLSPTNSSSAVGFGFPAKEETSTDALISSITEEPNEAGVAQKGVARKPFTSPSLGNGSATPNARTPSVPAKSPSMLGGVGSNQPTVPWLEELNAKQKRKSLMQDLERDVPPSSPTLNQSKPAPLATKRLPQTATASVGSDAQSAKPSEDTIITKPPLAQSQPYKSFSDDLQKQPQQPDLISTAAPARKVSSSFGKPEQSQSADQSQVSEPSSYVKDAALVPGSTAAIARHLQQQSQTSQLSSRSPISVSSNSSIQSNSNLTKPKLAKATISSGTSSTSISSTPSQGPLPLGETSHSAPVEANSSVNSQVTPLDHAEANPAVPNSETITSLDPSVKAPLIQNDPTLILPSSALSSTTPPSSHSVTRNTSTVSAPAVIPASAPIVAHLPSTDSTDSTNAGTIKVEEAVNAVLVVVLPKISELESRLEEQNREHCRQVKLLTEELDEERKKRACLEIELERLKRTMNNYAAHV